MSENTQVQDTQETKVEFNAFDDNSWVESPNEAEAKVETQTQQESPKVETKSDFDINSYVKEKFGFENEEEAINEITRLREKKQESFSFENEESEKFFKLLREGKEDDVYNFLTEKKRVEKLVNSSVDNVDIASEIIKASMQSKYKDLSADEIEYKFNKDFKIPPKPEQKYDQSDDEYNDELAAWERQKSVIEKEIIIEAKLVKPELESLKKDLRLPEIEQNQVSEENQELYQAVRKSYEENLNKEYSNFAGFNVTAKCEDAELPVAFIPTETEKAALKDKLFDFDPNDYLDKRWVNENGGIRIQQAMRDIYLLENFDAIVQKVANESAAKMLEYNIKNRANLNLNGLGSQRQVNMADKTFAEKQESAIWDA